MESAVQYFNRQIEDWVYWLGGAIWTPHNLAAVHSRGLETDNSFSYYDKSFKIELGLKTAYVLATTTESYLPGDGSIGKQIPYTPRYNFISYLSLSYKRLLLHYAHTYTGYRFVTVDESQYIDPYHAGSFQLGYTIYRDV